MRCGRTLCRSRAYRRMPGRISCVRYAASIKQQVKKVFLIHGEQDAADALTAKLKEAVGTRGLLSGTAFHCGLVSYNRAAFSGEVPERLNGTVSKTVVALVATVGSNPTLSASKKERQGLIVPMKDAWFKDWGWIHRPTGVSRMVAHRALLPVDCLGVRCD